MSDSYAVGGVTPVILTETSSDTTIADGALVKEQAVTTASISEAASAADAPAATLHAAAADTEAASAADAPAATVHAVASDTEAASAATSQSASGGTFNTGATEAASAADSPAATVTASASATAAASATDAPAATEITSASETAAASAADTPAVVSPIIPRRFYFAWVDEDQATFDPVAMAVYDEVIFSFDRILQEGQVPILDLWIKNPGMGLLAAGRKVWAWLSWTNPLNNHIEPLFFGVLEGIPTGNSPNQRIIKIRLQSRASTFIADKQALAETLKVAPYWDPIWVDVRHRDDPDAVLEARSGLFAWDPLTLAISFTDYLVGEDGTVDFPASKVLFGTFNRERGEAPLTNVQMQARVHWTQRTVGYVDVPPVSIASYTGSTFEAQWFKPGGQIGAGWRCETSFVNDVYKVARTPMASASSHWTNPKLSGQNSGWQNAISGDLGLTVDSSENIDAMHNCDVSSMEAQINYPALLSPGAISRQITEQQQTGICDPFSDPPRNVPSLKKGSGYVVPEWFLTCTATFRYEPRRQFVETVTFNITANTQAILTSPTVTQKTELITIDGADVGEPLIEYDAWTDFAGQFVDAGTMIYPNNPTTPGGLSYQVKVTPGIEGFTEPVFSDVPGTIVDGWASLGQGAEGIEQMAFATSYGAGTILLYRERSFDINLGELVETGNTAYYLCTVDTATTSQYTPVTYIPPSPTSDIPTNVPVTVFTDAFAPGPGMIAIDNPFLNIPIGGTPDEVTARCFFPTDRGRQAIDSLAMHVRARLRKRGRAVPLSWDSAFADVAPLTLRMNATVHNPNIEGGVATGKITRTELHADGTGRQRGHIEIGCSVGFGNSVTAITGTPTYAEAGYVQPGYQVYEGGQYVPGEEDLAITYPTFAPFDDGLSFPLQSFPGQISISGSAAAQVDPISRSIPVDAIVAGADQVPINAGIFFSGGWLAEELSFNNITKTLPYVMEANPVSADITLPPLTNGPFGGSYVLTATMLELPQGINLQAPSS